MHINMAVHRGVQMNLLLNTPKKIWLNCINISVLTNVFETVLIQPTIWVHLNRLDKAYKGGILLCDRQKKRGKIFCDDIWLIGQFIFKIVFEPLLTILRDNRYNIKGQGISISNVSVFGTNIHFYNLTKGGVL